MGIKKICLFGQKVQNLPVSLPWPGDHFYSSKSLTSKWTLLRFWIIGIQRSLEHKEIIFIENYSEHGSVIDNNKKDIPIINSDDMQKQNKKEFKQFSPKISENVLTKLAQTKNKDETIEFIEYL